MLTKPTSLSQLSKLLLFISRPTIFLIFIIYSNKSNAQITPVITPTGGFQIDGGLKAGTMSPTKGGDWFQGLSASYGYVLTTTSDALNPIVGVNTPTSGRKRDPFSSNNDDVFASGSKFNDYISALHWTNSSAPDKNDINNGLYHVGIDNSHNQWAVIAGDRLSTNGTSYIDFEFLQGNITVNSNGTFTGSGSAGGRTVNDMLVSMEYTSGGSKPNVYIYQWRPNAGSNPVTWSFQPYTMTDAEAFAETNRGGPETDVPANMAFGTTTYPQYSFVEAAINITTVLNHSGLACAGLNIQTLWIKTKASASSTAALKDFINPIAVNFRFGSTSITPIGPFCANDATPHTLSATPSSSDAVFSGPGVNGTTGGTYSFIASPLDPGTYTITYTASGCTATTTVQVLALPAGTVTGTASLCAGTPSKTVEFSANLGSPPYIFTYQLNGNTTTVTTSAGSHTVTVTAPNSVGTYVYKLLSVQDGGTVSCTNIASGTVTITVNPLPDAQITGGTIVCVGTASPVVTFTGSNGTAPYTFFYKINTGATSSITSVNGNTATITISTASAGTTTITLLSVQDASSTACSNTVTATVTVKVNNNPLSNAGTTPPSQCYIASGNTFDLLGSVSNGTASWTTLNPPSGYTVSFVNAHAATTSVTITGLQAGTVTLVLYSNSDATPSCGSVSSTVVVSINGVPSAPTACVIQPTLCLGKATGKIVFTPIAGAQYSINDGASWSSCNVFTGVAAGTVSQIRVKTAISQGGCISAPLTCAGLVTTCTEEPTPCPPLSVFNNKNAEDNVITQQITLPESKPSVIAYPNPYNNKIRFIVTAPEKGRGSLELFNVLGQKMKTVYQGEIIEGTQVFETYIPPQQRANLIYVMTLNGKTASGKMIAQ